MELVEGETLHEHIVGAGALPLDEALGIAFQMADALESAHERGIVHRDLKPANVKVFGDPPAVKVLDFGLAKAVETNRHPTPAISNSPTLSVMATGAGVILGTAAYMSPEQAKGLPADHRTDIFAFGCVRFEMLTGRMAFGGDSVPEILASVIRPSPTGPRCRRVCRRDCPNCSAAAWRNRGENVISRSAMSASISSTSAGRRTPPPTPERRHRAAPRTCRSGAAPFRSRRACSSVPSRRLRASRSRVLRPQQHRWCGSRLRSATRRRSPSSGVMSASRLMDRWWR